MECPKCGSDNPDNKKFCHECGSNLLNICPQCGTEICPGDKFCGDCGYNLALIVSATVKDLSLDEKLDKLKNFLPKDLTEKILARRDRIEGEQKLVTVMFCDMVGFTAISEKLSAEQVYSIMDRVYEILIQKVHDFEGTVNEMTGDGIMALFGAPIALEDAPQRAVRSACAVHREISRFNNQLTQEHSGLPQVKMRIGIHTGPVVVGTLGNDLRVEFKAVGDTVNIASRIEGLAESGTSYVSGETFRLTEGMFRYEALGEKHVKGRDAPVRVYRVIAPSSRRTRFDISAERGLTPLLGRERELELLLDGFERVKGGMGQSFSIVAEAGVGKSRLLYEFRKAVSNEDVTFLEGRCLSYSRRVAYHPVIDVLKSGFEVYGDDSDEEKRDKVRRGLGLMGVDEEAALPYILELFSVKDSGIDRIPLSPEARKARIFEAVTRVVLKRSEIRPLVMAVEDLHWTDASSEETFKELLGSISGARVMLIFTYRPDFVHTWGGRSYHSQVNLNRLTNRESLTMVANILGAEEVERGLEEFILGRTEGVPFFIEEFIKSLIDLRVIEKRGRRYTAVKELEGVGMPPTVQEVIMARVDSLPEGVKKLLQLGSVIGREFGWELVKAVSSEDERELLSRCSVLKDSELIYERGIYPQSTYVFRHALTQDAVYGSMLKSTREKYHGVVAEVLENRFRRLVEQQPELMGHHYTEAGLVDESIPYWQRAGEMATRRSANVEAYNHFDRGVELLRTLPETPERLKQELELTISGAASWSAVKGFGSWDSLEDFNRRLQHYKKVADPAQIYWISYALWGHNLIWSRLRQAKKLAVECLDLAMKTQDPELLMEAHRVNDETAFYRGEFNLARKHFEQGYAIYVPEKHHNLYIKYGQDPGVALLAHGAVILWHLGFPDQAVKRAEEAESSNMNWPHPFSNAFALYCSTILYQYRREVQNTRDRTEQCISISKEHKFPFWLAMSSVIRGWVLSEQGCRKEGISQIHEGMADCRSRKIECLRTYQLALLADAYRKNGQPDECLRALDEALAMAESTEQRHYEAECNRLKGQVLLDLGKGEPEAESFFRRAIDVSKKQKARSMELRACVSLSRLLQNQGKTEEAREMLSGIYNWFTEGFDTADLKEAKALLDELALV